MADHEGGTPGSCLTMAALFGGAGWGLVNSGEALLVLGGYGCGLIALTLAARGWRALSQARAQHRLLEAAQVPSGVHGSAQWAGQAEAKAARMFERGGLLLGWNGRYLYHNGEAGHLVIAPPGAGKTTCFTIPNGLTYARGAVFTDPRGEVAAVIGRHRARAMGHAVHYLNPHGVLGLPDSGFNPLSLLEPGPEIKDTTALLAALLLPGHARGNATDEFFLRAGRTLLAAGMLWMAAGRWQAGCTLAQLNLLLRQPA